MGNVLGPGLYDMFGDYWDMPTLGYVRNPLLPSSCGYARRHVALVAAHSRADSAELRLDVSVNSQMKGP